MTNFNPSWPHKYQRPEYIYIPLCDIVTKNEITSYLIKIVLFVGTVWCIWPGSFYQILPLLLQLWNTRSYFLSFCKTINRINFVERKDVFIKKKATLTFFGNLLSIFIYIFDIFRLHMRTKFCQLVYLTDLKYKKVYHRDFFLLRLNSLLIFYLYIFKLMMIRMVSSCILDLLICKLVSLVGF